MELYFFRHGEAEPASAGGTDEARELTARGRQESRSTAEALLRAGLRPEAIYTSPLIRARQTGEILGEVFGLHPQAHERLRCGAGLGDVQALAAERGLARIMLVGHEPDLSTIVHQLTGGRVKMRTSCCARVDADRVEPGLGMLVWLLGPEVLPSPEPSS